MSGDPERDDPNPRPTAPAGVLGGPGKRPESAPVETGARVPKNVFAHTIVGLQVPAAAPQQSEQAEPLRDPSDRPAPVPYKRAQGAWGGTLPMPEPSNPGNRSAERMVAAQPHLGGQGSSPVQVRPAAIVGTPETREPTVRMPTTAGAAPASPRPPSNRSVPPPPPPSGAPPAMPSPKPAVKSAAPQPQPKRDDPSVPRLALGVEKIPSQETTSLEITGQSQPLQLSLDARDHVESSLRPESAAPKRSMLPWIVLAVLGLVGGLAYAFLRGGEPAAPERVVAVPAAVPAVEPTPKPEAPAATPVPEAAAQAAAPVPAPAAPVVAPKAPTKVAPAKQEEEQAAKPAAKRKASHTKKRATSSSSGPVLKVTPSGETDLEAAARAAERLAEPEEDLEPADRPAPPPPSPDEE